MNYDFLLCSLCVRFELPHEVKPTDESRPFLMSRSGGWEKTDLVFQFHPVDVICFPKENGFWAVNSFYIAGEKNYRIYHCPIRGQPPYCCVEWNRSNPHFVNCAYVKGEEHRIEYTKNLIELLSLEMFLLQFSGFILHSSVVAWDGKGILFSAPSGTGKSTQAALWEKHMGSQTLNGDRAGIRCADGVWRAYGLPFAGTSGIYRNESVPINAIVLLKQGPENIITPVTPMEAFRKLLPECSAWRWDSGFMDRLIGILSAVIQDVPIYQLECRPDYEAVALLRDTILEER